MALHSCSLYSQFIITCNDSKTRTRELINKAILGSLVTNYEPLIDNLKLPDIDDRHVLVTATHSGAQAIITFTLKDFPQKILGQYGIEAIHPDAFIEYQLDTLSGCSHCNSKTTP